MGKLSKFLKGPYSGVGADTYFGEGASLDVRSLSTLSQSQNDVLNQLLKQFTSEGLTNFSPGNVSPFGGDLSAEMSTGEMTSLAALEQAALVDVNQNAELNSLTNQALMEVIQGGGNPSDFGEFFKTNVEDPALRDFSQNVRPTIDRSYGGSSFFSSDRQKADTMATEELIRNLTGTRANLALQTKEAANDRLLQALGLSTERSRLGTEQQNSKVQNLLTAFTAAGTEREVAQGSKDREYAEFVRQQEGETRLRDERSRRIEQILASLGIKSVENLGAMNPGKAGLVQAFLGGGGGGALAGLIGSDRRLKENVKRIGTTPGGLPKYRFNYIGEPTEFIGVMADDVEKVIPDAVTEVDGYKYVDYSKVN